jgi:hypothetical protein
MAERRDAERENIAGHLAYELSMLWASAKAMGQAVPAVNYCVVEAFALHARNVTDFFYCDTPQKDDVVAAHFFSDPAEWPKVRPAMPALLEEARRRANKEVSHLTYARLLVAPDARAWPTREIIAALDPALRAFCERADLLPERVRLLRYRELLP